MMEENLTKTKVIVFRNGGVMSKNGEVLLQRVKVQDNYILWVSRAYIFLEKLVVKSIINTDSTDGESSQYCEKNDMEARSSKS